MLTCKPILPENTQCFEHDSVLCKDLKELQNVEMRESFSAVEPSLVDKPESVRPAGLEVGRLESSQVAGVRLVLTTSLPVSYPDQFYKRLGRGELEGRVGVTAGRVVACVVWGQERGNTHLLALAVLPTHRGRGIGSCLLAACLATATRPFLHVQTDNASAVRFYSRHGFTVVKTVPDYYRRQLCRDAFRMELAVP